VIPNMERRYRETDSAWVREEFERYQNNRPCGTCDGYRLRAEALAVKIAGVHVGEVVQKSIREALDWVNSVPASLSNQKNEIARAILKEIGERLGFLNNVGLEYLSLSRNSGTLSGGESQRIRLASARACGGALHEDRLPVVDHPLLHRQHSKGAARQAARSAPDGLAAADVRARRAPPRQGLARRAQRGHARLVP